MKLLLILKAFVLRVFQAGKRWAEDGASLMAAGVAYFLAVSLFPLLLILISGLGLFFEYTDTGDDARKEIAHQVAEKFSPNLGQQVDQLIENTSAQAKRAGPFGIGALLFTAMLTFTAFDRAFNRILKMPEEQKKSGIWATVKRVLLVRLKAFLMLGGVGIMLLVSVLISTTLEGLHQYLPGTLPGADWAWRGFNIGVSMLLNVLLFTILYHEVPETKVLWRHAFRAALLAAVTWEIGRQVLASVVVGDKFSAYGLVGAFIAILVWVYYGVNVILLGAEYIEVLVEERRKKLAKSRPPARPTSPSSASPPPRS